MFDSPILRAALYTHKAQVPFTQGQSLSKRCSMMMSIIKPWSGACRCSVTCRQQLRSTVVDSWCMTPETFQLVRGPLPTPVAAHAGVSLGRHLHSLVALDLGPGNTAFLPGGWLSATAAVEATLAVGGVWMQTAALRVQLQAWSIEVTAVGVMSADTMQWCSTDLI